MSVCAVINEVTAEYSLTAHTSERKFLIKNVDNRTAAEAEIAAGSAAYDGTMIRKGWSLKQIAIDAWEATVKYSSIPALAIGTTKISGSTKGGTFKATHALDHISTTPKTGTHPGHNGAINVTKDGIDGVDIYVPTFSFRVDKAFAPGTLTDAYMKTLTTATACINDATWYGFAKGEVLFTGAEFEKTLELETVSYDFECSVNLEDVTIAGITINTTPPARPAKEGWDYLWVEYHEKTDDATGFVVQEAVAIHVERVYEYFNFALLGI